MRIAVCDDQLIFAQEFSCRLRRKFDALSQSCSIELFTSGEALGARDTVAPFDVVFLDIDMPGQTGFETATRLRRNSNVMKIIFVSNRSDLVFDSFVFQPYRFLRKECLDSELAGIVHSLCPEEPVHTITAGSWERAFPLSEILYLESQNHTIILHTQKETVPFRGSLNEQESLLGKQCFVRCHVGYLANCRAVKLVNKTELLLSNGETIPVSRSRLKAVEQKYLEFLRRRPSWN